MQPSITLSLNQHLELEQSRRHLDGIDDLQRLKEMAKEFLLNWQLERAESKRIIQAGLGHQTPIHLTTKQGLTRRLELQSNGRDTVSHTTNA